MSDDKKVRPNNDPVKPDLERKGLRPTDFLNAPASEGRGKSDHASSPLAANTQDVPVDGRPKGKPPTAGGGGGHGRSRDSRYWGRRRRLLLEETADASYYPFMGDRSYNSSSITQRGSQIATTTGDFRYIHSYANTSWGPGLASYFQETELTGDYSKVYMELHFYSRSARANDNSPPFINVGRTLVGGSGWTNANTVAYQPWKNTTVSEVRYNSGATVDTISGVYYDSGSATFMIAIDTDNSKIWFGKNGSWVGAGTQDPATNQGGYWITAWDTSTYATGADGMQNPLGIYVSNGGTNYDATDDIEYRVSEEYWTYAAPVGFVAWPKYTPQVTNSEGTLDTVEWVPTYVPAPTNSQGQEFCHNNGVTFGTGLFIQSNNQITSYDTWYEYNKIMQSGKWYWEVQWLKGGLNSNTTWCMGVIPSATYALSGKSALGSTADGAIGFGAGGLVQSNGTSNPAPYSAGGYIVNSDSRTSAYVTPGDTYMFAFDADNGRFYVGMNGTWFESQDPTNASHGIAVPTGCDQIATKLEGSGSAICMINTGGKAFIYDAPVGYSPPAASPTFNKSGTQMTMRDPTYAHDTILTTATTTINKPTGVADGDFMVLCTWSNQIGSNCMQPTLTGEGATWNKSDEVYATISSGGETQWLEMWWKFAASEPSSYTIKNNSASTAECHAICMAGANAKIQSLGSNAGYSVAWYNPGKPFSTPTEMNMPGSKQYAMAVCHTAGGGETINAPPGWTLLHTDTSLTSFMAVAERDFPIDGTQTKTFIAGGLWDISGAPSTAEWITSNFWWEPYVFA